MSGEWLTDPIQPYALTVEGRWCLSSAAFGLLAEYVTCACGQQKNLTFETDSGRFGELADIICPSCDGEFQIPEITGYDLKARIDYLHGQVEEIEGGLIELWLADPDSWTGPVDDEDQEHEDLGADAGHAPVADAGGSPGGGDQDLAADVPVGAGAATEE